MEREKREAGAIDDAVVDVASATECTGLMPALPESAASEETVAALYAVHRPVARKGKPVAK